LSCGVWCVGVTERPVFLTGREIFDYACRKVFEFCETRQWGRRGGKLLGWGCGKFGVVANADFAVVETPALNPRISVDGGLILNLLMDVDNTTTRT
jgi:hypothetical protein